MSDPDHSAAPRLKEVMPRLDVRAPRPPVVRLRKSIVTLACMSAAGILAGSLAWAFVVQPEARATSRAQKLARQETEVRGTVRPSERVTDQPATYGQLNDRLPEPRRLGQAADRSEEGTQRTPRAKASPPPNTGDGLRARALESGLFFAAASGNDADRRAEAEKAAPDPRPDYAAVYNAHALLAPLSPYELKAGAVIPALLLTGVDTSRAGPVVASVTDNIYDTVSGRHLIIPQGARLIGRHEGESRHGDRRAFLTWDRLILPNGKSLVLTKEPGVDAKGAIGSEGEVDRRLFPLAMATLLAGAITTVGEVARDDEDHSGGWLGDAGDAASIQAAQVGGRLVDRELDVRPSIRLRPGARVRVLITRDLILEPYR